MESDEWYMKEGVQIKVRKIYAFEKSSREVSGENVKITVDSLNFCTAGKVGEIRDNVYWQLVGFRLFYFENCVHVALVKF